MPAAGFVALVRAAAGEITGIVDAAAAREQQAVSAATLLIHHIEAILQSWHVCRRTADGQRDGNRQRAVGGTQAGSVGGRGRGGGDGPHVGPRRKARRGHADGERRRRSAGGRSYTEP